MMTKLQKLTCALAVLYVPLLGLFPLANQHASAASASNWKAGRIIDDPYFTANSSMSVTQIQQFLNEKVGSGGGYGTPGVCDTNGTKTSELGGGTRAQYGADHGNPAPFTCLKDYYEVPKTSPGPDVPASNYGGAPIPAGAESAAQLIWDAAQRYSISPKVLLVTIQKESVGPLTTDDWPFKSQYTYAMGAHCPDSGPGGSANCDPNYSGFSIQISESAALFRYYLDNMDQSWWPYKRLGTNSILYNPNAGCGSSNVDIVTKATAALYTYTPYQPNQAALNNLYGTGDSCSAYGNRNFWRIYTDWFGPPINDSLFFQVIQGPNSPAVFLQTPAGKYYLPSGQIMQDWGLDKYPVTQVSQSYVDSLPTRDWVGHLLKDDWGNMFVVEGGKLHYVRDASYLPLWNLDPNTAVQSLGIAYTLPGTTWAGRFVQDASQSSGPVYLLDKGQKHLVPDANMLYEWRYTFDQLTTVSSTFLSGITTGGDVTQYASDGTNGYVVDSGRKLSFSNGNIQNAYYGSQLPVTYASATLSMLPTNTATQFTVNTSTGQWFMLDGGKKHYIPSGDLAALWGKSSSTPLTGMSNSYLVSTASASDLTYVVQTASPSQYWLVDGNKHYIPNSDVANAWLAAGTSPPVYSTQSLNLLPQGMDATTTINVSGSPYTYMMDNRVRHYLMTPSAKSAWGGTVLTISPSLLSLITEGEFINYTAKNSTGQIYLLMNGTAYAIDSAFYDAWGVTAGVPLIGDQTLARYPLSGNTLKAFIKTGNSNYIMSRGSKTPVNRFNDAYQLPYSSTVTLPNDYFATAGDASYLVSSTDANDSRTWLINQGKKIQLGFEQAVSYGYLSQGVPRTAFSPATLSSIPDDTTVPSLLIQKQGSGIKLLSFGYALGFPDGSTLTNYISSSNPILQVSPSIFDSFTLRRSTSRLIEDDRGNYYWMENGQKRHILSWSVLTRYQSTPVTYLEGTTMYLIPGGPEINQ